MLYKVTVAVCKLNKINQDIGWGGDEMQAVISEPMLQMNQITTLKGLGRKSCLDNLAGAGRGVFQLDA